MDEGASVRYSIASAETNEQRNSGAQGNRFGQRLTYEEHCIYLHNTPACLAPYTGGVYGIFGARVLGFGWGARSATAGASGAVLCWSSPGTP